MSLTEVCFCNPCSPRAPRSRSKPREMVCATFWAGKVTDPPKRNHVSTTFSQRSACKSLRQCLHEKVYTLDGWADAPCKGDANKPTYNAATVKATFPIARGQLPCMMHCRWSLDIISIADYELIHDYIKIGVARRNTVKVFDIGVNV